mmetsp:Transcript_18534/g.26049  ORF Transcript_18534/g.26049 Transcript_18534/m.26049 type:complete len:92 (-) Transcript_18534:175-450(-)
MSAGQGAECQREEWLWAEEDQATLSATPNPSNLPYAWHQLPQDWHQMTAGYHMLPQAQQTFHQYGPASQWTTWNAMAPQQIPLKGCYPRWA